eukprot:Lithocolla_globosa_v1_NODE_5946_length_1159_cov_5.596014.p1 type:complete len:160 gc:universal NODE_5946_length_1159_cov_5.596014:1106-627(-)
MILGPPGNGKTKLVKNMLSAVNNPFWREMLGKEADEKILAMAIAAIRVQVLQQAAALGFTSHEQVRSTVGPERLMLVDRSFHHLQGIKEESKPDLLVYDEWGSGGRSIIQSALNEFNFLNTNDDSELKKYLDGIDAISKINQFRIMVGYEAPVTILKTL